MLYDNLLALYEKNNKPKPDELEKKLIQLEDKRKEYIQDLNEIVECLSSLNELDENNMQESIQEIRKKVFPFYLK